LEPYSLKKIKSISSKDFLLKKKKKTFHVTAFTKSSAFGIEALNNTEQKEKLKL
jgi:hypothetical protein